MSPFQKQTAMDIKHHQNRLDKLNRIKPSLNRLQSEMLLQSLRILENPHKGYNSSQPECQCGCREIFKPEQKAV